MSRFCQKSIIAVPSWDRWKVPPDPLPLTLLVRKGQRFQRAPW